MWQSLTDNIPTVAAFATASLGVLGAMRDELRLSLH